MSGISVTNTPAICPVCEFTTNDNIGTCPKCGGKLLQTEERLDAEEGHDQGKFFAVVSALFLLAILIIYNPWGQRHLNDFVGFWSSVLTMGPIAGIFTGLVFMLTRTQNQLITYSVLIVLTVILVALDRLLFINFF